MNDRALTRWVGLAVLLLGLASQAGGSRAAAAPPILQGSLELRGEALGSPGEDLVVEGRVVGYGLLRASRLVNRGAIVLSVGSSEVAGVVENLGSIDVTRGTARFSQAVTNRGSFKITDAEVHFAAPFSGLGAYVSDPSDNYFTDLIIGGSGYLVGGAGDRFFVNGDFISSSSNNTSWNTVDAYLEFRTGVDTQHAFHITGAELGPKDAGYTDNFAWGTLHIAPANDLVLFDGNAALGAALYAGEVTGAAISGSAVTNISGAAGVNIYYQPDLPANAYLGGLVYDFGGSGRLLPIQPPVPMPAAPGWSVAVLALLLVLAGKTPLRLCREGAGEALD